jgi:DNA-binding NarL/FixJ family response regulator
MAVKDLAAGSETARTSFERSLTLARELGDVWGVARASNCLGELARTAGDVDQAAQCYEKSLALFRQVGQPKQVVNVLLNLGHVAIIQGDPRRGAAHFADGLELAAEHGDRRCEGFALAGMAAVAALLDQPERAAHLFGASDAVIEAIGMPLEPIDAAACARHRAIAHAALGPARFDAAVAAGRTLSQDQALAEARRVRRDDEAGVARRPTRTTPHGLSPRELDVLRLLAEGQSDREIAEALSITYRTATSYVTAILNKLGVPSRTAAATYAVRQGLA